MFNQQLRNKRKELGYTQKDIAGQLGIAVSTYSGYELGTSEPSFEIVRQLSSILGTDANYFLEIDSFKMTFDEQNLINQFRKTDTTGQRLIKDLTADLYDRCIRTPKTVLKPLYEASLSAGTGQFVFDDIPTTQINVPLDYSNIDFVINVSGDSMKPLYNNGDRVMIKKENVNIGEIGAFMIDGEAYIKRRGSDRLISENPKYEDILFNENMRIDLIGHVIGKL